jgi:predicted ATPase
MKLLSTDLAYPTLTRSRGAMAYLQLKPLLNEGAPIEIDLVEDQPISLSFLDELVRLLGDSQASGQVTFLVHSEDILRKLSRIAAMRSVDVWAQGVDGNVRFLVPPVPFDEPEATQSGAKPSIGKP